MKTFIKLVIVAFVICWVFDIFWYNQEVKKVDSLKIQDNCDMNIQVNDCVVISTDR